MRRVKAPRRKPTDAELAILRVLWTRGPSTVRQIAAVMGRESGYTTFLKLLQIMTEKRLVVRDESARTHVYEAAYTQDQTQRQLVTDLLERAFDGSAAQLVLQALAAARSSPEELAEIRKLLRGAGDSVKNDDIDARKTGGSR
ncbi:MAG: transcriptional regulator [Acidobacteria bacterium]|nr:MAG: transcriptional regulator [Acidobacteriota bacterium]PYR22793.1 MAG: transcriptional regulator [Acidobacteriota bacterium]PYR48757.1 MAG: transcriptional regulator [Acidobacteriota bacterium]